MNKLLCYITENIRNRKVLNNYKQLKINCFSSRKDIEQRKLTKLLNILNHSYKNVPYYKSIFKKYNLVEDNKIKLDDVSDLSLFPILKKRDIQNNFHNLKSQDICNRKAYQNSTGGSTGEPVIFMQDNIFQNNNLANFLLSKSFKGVSPYDSSVILWGAERDIFKGNKSFKYKLIDILLNSTTLNTFKMNKKNMIEYLKIINTKKPKFIQSYVQSIYELSKFAKKNKILIEKQNVIHTAAGTLYDFMRKEIEEVFQCKVFDHYGSREVGAIASECSDHSGLHIFEDHIIVEIVKKDGSLCESNEKGEILVTTLNNYSMPLVRYKIGDIGIKESYSNCKCGCNYEKLKEITGRTTDLFKTINNDLIDGEYFTHLFYNIKEIEKFQVIQEDYSLIILKIVKNNDINDVLMQDIMNKIKIVMGKDCKIQVDFVKEIPLAATGKFIYTVSKLKNV